MEFYLSLIVDCFINLRDLTYDFNWVQDIDEQRGRGGRSSDRFSDWRLIRLVDFRDQYDSEEGGEKERRPLD